tara:strand:- start:311 stop:475 length:165 start_codon:yes stop_codon:yes gene_type:complete
MLLYTEEQLQVLYGIYAKHQSKAGVGFMRLEDFRELFEEQQSFMLHSIELNEVV